jgi:hypothetical protein
MNPFTHVVLASALALGVSSLAPGVASAKVHITVDLDRQTIHIEAKNQTFDWKVSSGKDGFETPAGKYGVLWMDKDHHSDEYDQAPMPNAIFFAPGYAIHGAYKSDWGRPASHGCVRLPVAKSAILFDLVKAQGADVTITGYSPATVTAAVHAKPKVNPDADPYGDPSGADPMDEARDYGYPPVARPSRDGYFGSVY